MFTVFTPTRDRAHTLGRVYSSLSAQTTDDFEWLIVDDGSRDETPALIESWIGTADFPIRVIRKDSSEGKFEAMRSAVAAAGGRFFLTLDSDDACVPDALERLHHAWLSIPAEHREEFSAVTGLCADEQGRLVGTPFPRDPTDSNSLEMRWRHRVRGEKWGFQRTDVMRATLSDLEGRASFVPEGYLWDAIARRYRTRYINVVLRTYFQDQVDRLSTTTDLARTAPGAVLSYGSLLNKDLRWMRYAPIDFWRQAAYFVRFALHAHRSLHWQWRSLTRSARALWLAAAPAGTALYILDRAGLQHRIAAIRRRRHHRATG